jgi:hypothetical protein
MLEKRGPDLTHAQLESFIEKKLKKNLFTCKYMTFGLVKIIGMGHEKNRHSFIKVK